MNPRKKPLIWFVSILVVTSFLLVSCAGAPTQEECLEGEADDIALQISETYEVSYEKVMSWVCVGFVYDDIILALETHDLMPDYSADSLLARLADDQTWEQIWREIGLTE